MRLFALVEVVGAELFDELVDAFLLFGRRRLKCRRFLLREQWHGAPGRADGERQSNGERNDPALLPHDVSPELVPANDRG